MKHENKYEQGVRKEEEELLRLQQISEGLDLNVKSAKPCLYHVVNFVTNYFVRFLPRANCLGCNEKLVCKLKESIKTDGMRPERSYCGHWMHYNCAFDFVNQPPFLRQCPDPKCEEDYGSRNFLLDEGSVKSREKVYMQT